MWKKHSTSGLNVIRPDVLLFILKIGSLCNREETDWFQKSFRRSGMWRGDLFGTVCYVMMKLQHKWILWIAICAAYWNNRSVAEKKPFFRLRNTYAAGSMLTIPAFWLRSWNQNGGIHVKCLVAYFSAGGRTAGFAQALAEIASADLFEIRPENP